MVSEIFTLDWEVHQNSYCKFKFYRPYHVSDMVIFGKRTDMQMFFESIPMYEEDEVLRSDSEDRKYKMLQSQNALVLDGVDYGGWSSSVTKSKLTMYLMARNNNGLAGNFFKGRIYGFKIYENNILVVNLIPVLDDNKVPCFYDKISNELLYNKGTGEFNYSL